MLGDLVRSCAFHRAVPRWALVSNRRASPDNLHFTFGSSDSWCGEAIALTVADVEFLKRPSYDSTGWLNRAVERAEVQTITPHDLRHSCASLAVSSGANVLAVSRMLGH